MASDPVLRIVDAEAGGDISRVIIDGAPALEGGSIASQCGDFSRRYDHLRLKLIRPPFGELHMCPVLLRPACMPDADFGVIIMESMGYPPISGSNLFCATAVALEYGFAGMHEPESRLRVETPAGVVSVTARCSNGRCRVVEFENTPARITMETAVSIGSPSDPLPVTVISAGVDYAVVDAADWNISLAPEFHDALVETGSRIATAAGTDFVLFHEAFETKADGGSCRVAVFQSPSVICRNPTGTGTSALLALLHSRGIITAGHSLTALSPSGTSFLGRILGVEQTPTGPALRTAISGAVTLHHELTIP